MAGNPLISPNYNATTVALSSIKMGRRVQLGQVMQFDVFMNLYGLNGDRLVSDIRLPGLPVGRYGEHLLVIDYGSAGRRHDATQVTLARVPLRGGALASK